VQKLFLPPFLRLCKEDRAKRTIFVYHHCDAKRAPSIVCRIAQELLGKLLEFLVSLQALFDLPVQPAELARREAITNQPQTSG